MPTYFLTLLSFYVRQLDCTYVPHSVLTNTTCGPACGNVTLYHAQLDLYSKVTCWQGSHRFHAFFAMVMMLIMLVGGVGWMVMMSDAANCGNQIQYSERFKLLEAPLKFVLVVVRRLPIPTTYSQAQPAIPQTAPRPPFLTARSAPPLRIARRRACGHRFPAELRGPAFGL